MFRLVKIIIWRSAHNFKLRDILQHQKIHASVCIMSPAEYVPGNQLLPEGRQLRDFVGKLKPQQQTPSEMTYGDWDKLLSVPPVVAEVTNISDNTRNSIKYVFDLIGSKGSRGDTEGLNTSGLEYSDISRIELDVFDNRTIPALVVELDKGANIVEFLRRLNLLAHNSMYIHAKKHQKRLNVTAWSWL